MTVPALQGGRAVRKEELESLKDHTEQSSLLPGKGP